MAEGEGTSPTSSPGARLAAAREKARLSQSEAAERLHLQLQVLQGLEQGHLERLGASVYARGHLRRYAELVGVPEDEILRAYDAWSGRLASQPDLSGVITAPAVRKSVTQRRTVKPAHALIGAIVLVVVMVVWWAMRKLPHETHVATTGSAPAQTEGVPPADIAAPENAVPSTAPPPTPAPAPATTARRAPGAGASLPATPTATPAAAPPVGTPPGQVRLALNFSENSWIEIYGADGKRLFHGMVQKGSRHEFSGSSPLRVFLGNPPAVTLAMNGQPVALTGHPKPRRFTIDDGGNIVPVVADATSAKGSTTEPRSD